MIDAVSGVACGAAGVDGAGAAVTNGEARGVEADEAEEEGAGTGGNGESGWTDSGFAVEELKRSCREGRMRSASS